MSKELTLEMRIKDILDENDEYDYVEGKSHFSKYFATGQLLTLCTELATTSNDVGYNMGIDAAIKVLQVVIAVHPRIEPQLNIAIKNLNELKYPINTNTNEDR